MSDIRAELRHTVAEIFRHMGAGDDVEVVVERSARPEFGDWSSPAAMRAAKALRRSPMQIAQEAHTLLAQRTTPHVKEWTVTPPGYLNARLDDDTWIPNALQNAMQLDITHPLTTADAPTPPRKTLIEHTQINTNKAAHVGHLRNACIGDTVARILRRIGHRVEITNYIDDTGVQVADVVVGIRELGMQAKPEEPIDQFCSRVYVEARKRFETDPVMERRRREVLHAIEQRDNDIAAFAKELSQKIVNAHLTTMARFNITYDLLNWESDILELGFWKRAFELMRDAGVISLAESGRHAGCWILPWGTGIKNSDDESTGDDEQDAKVIVKSDGTATYVAKDIANQLWKFGLLGKDFEYRKWDTHNPASPTTTIVHNGDPDLQKMGYGHVARVINVIDARQAYPQQVVAEAVRQLGYKEQAKNSIHLAYEVVALSAQAAKDLGLDVSDGRELYAFSGRQGIAVRADDLLNIATTKTGDKAQDEHIARALAAGAVRYYLQKFSLSQIIAFDFEEALRTTGDTGVYLQYAHARAAGILRKVPDDGAPLQLPESIGEQERALLMHIDSYRYALTEAAAALSPVVLTTYAFNLATALSDVYEHTPAIVRETDPVIRRFRRYLVAATKATLADALATLGMAALDQI